MNQINIKIVKCLKDATIPSYKTEGAAACDLHSSEEHVLFPNQTTIVSTGLKLEIPKGYYGQISLRSGIGASSGLIIPNGVGILDSDYRGVVGIILRNCNTYNYQINVGDRLAQILFLPVTLGIFEEVESLSETNRGEGGFGSTGVK